MRHLIKTCPEAQYIVNDDFKAPEQIEELLKRPCCDDCIPHDEYLLCARDFHARAKLDWQFLVAQFHEAMAIDIGQTPGIRRAQLRKDLLKEEYEETIAAIDANDLPETIDGICDLIYVALGAAVEFGVNLHKPFRAVHESNMKKAEGGKDARGKQLKPIGWTPPDIAGLLREQGWKGE